MKSVTQSPQAQVVVSYGSVTCHWGGGDPVCCWYFLSTHTWIHSYLHRADSNQDSKMSFKEIKSLLRMVNVDMNDMYAYRLFKVNPDFSCSVTTLLVPAPFPPCGFFIGSLRSLQKTNIWA